MYYWMFLGFAIVTEVMGTLSMKYNTSEWPFLGLGIMYLMLTISYSCLAIAVKRIPIAVAFGAWESIGLILITLLSALFFAETLGLLKILAIVLMIVGMLLLEHGTEMPKTRERR